jgi:chromosome segregation ATPase
LNETGTSVVTKWDKMESRLANINQRLAGIEAKLAGIEAKLDRIDSEVEATKHGAMSVVKRFMTNAERSVNRYRV